jgi:pimeloyl-ACP methyl ester carboxylesterase
MKLTRKLLWMGSALWAVALTAGIGFWMRPVSYFNGVLYVREALTGVENREVTVEGHRMHYLAAGPAGGPVVVLVHGLGGRAEDWSNLAPYFARAGFRVYMPDLFGFGRSEKPAEFSYSVHDQANVVVDFMDALGLKEVELGGWSMGGWIVQIVAGTHPERVKRLMVFDSAGLYEKPDWNTNLFMPKTAVELDELEALLTPDPPRIPGFVARDILRISAEHRWVTQRAIDTMLTGKDTTDSLLQEMKMPVLILWGKEDHITPLDEGKKMQQLIPESKLLVYDGCGHLAPEQCAAAMGPTLVEFLKK